MAPVHSSARCGIDVEQIELGFFQGTDECFPCLLRCCIPRESPLAHAASLTMLGAFDSGPLMLKEIKGGFGISDMAGHARATGK